MEIRKLIKTKKLKILVILFLNVTFKPPWLSGIAAEFNNFLLIAETCNLQVAGSNPVGGLFFLFFSISKPTK